MNVDKRKNKSNRLKMKIIQLNSRRFQNIVWVWSSLHVNYTYFWHRSINIPQSIDARLLDEFRSFLRKYHIFYFRRFKKNIYIFKVALYTKGSTIYKPTSQYGDLDILWNCLYRLTVLYIVISQLSRALVLWTTDLEFKSTGDFC